MDNITIITQPDGLLTLKLGLLVVDLRVQPAVSYYQVGNRTATRATPAHHAVLVNICVPWAAYLPHHARLSEVGEWLTALGVDIRPLNDEAARQGWPVAGV